LWRYARAVKRLVNSNERDLGALYQSLARWWYALAISVFALVLYGGWVTLGPGRLMASRSLSQRFHAKPGDQSAVRVEFRLAEDEAAEGLIEATVSGTTQTIFLHKDPLLTNRDISHARVVVDEENGPAVDVTFAEESREKVLHLTETNRGKLLAILVDGRVIMAPVIREPIGTEARIWGRFSREEAERIARGLTGEK
jgi:preprotein translocase subunit SecD